MRKQIVYSQGSYQDDRFVQLRMAERARFPKGEEVETEFRGRDAFEGFGMARKAAFVYAGLLSPSSTANTIPFVGELGPYSGHVVGSQTIDTKQGWRIDWNPRTGEFHINWWDRRLDKSPKGDRDKAQHFFGANFVAGGTLDLFREIESHFPGQVKEK
jgi:hypothetical protein